MPRDATPEELRKTCDMPEAHEAHMRMNGECPWCDAPFDPSRIDPNFDVDHPED